jgi:hypothetical protein
MTQPSTNLNPILRSEQILNAFSAVLRARVPLDLQRTRITADDVWHVLCYASVHGIRIEAACQALAGAPSGNRLREVRGEALAERPVLQRQLNTILRVQLPRVFFKGKRDYRIALDITLIPYHGKPHKDEAEVLRAQAKCGTNHFHGYATVSLVHDRRRPVLALRFLPQHESMVQIVRDLLDRVKRLKIGVRRVYLDKELYRVAVLQTLDRRGLAYVLPVPARAQSAEMQRVCQGRRSHCERYTLQGRQQGA